MKVLVATARTQGQRANDFNHAKEGELVRFGLECDGEAVDGKCGCRRAMSGLETGKSSTTFTVEDRDLSEAAYSELIKANLISGGWITEPVDDEDRQWVKDEMADLLKLADAFPVGEVVEKRGEKFQTRLAKV